MKCIDRFSPKFPRSFLLLFSRRSRRRRLGDYFSDVEARGGYPMLIEQFYSSFIHLNSTDLNLVNIHFLSKVNLYSIQF